MGYLHALIIIAVLYVLWVIWLNRAGFFVTKDGYVKYDNPYFKKGLRTALRFTFNRLKNGR